MTADSWDVRDLPDALALEVCGGGDLALVLIQGENRVRVELAHVQTLVAALIDKTWRRTWPGADDCP